MKDSKLICGIGINDKSRPAWIGDNHTKQYNLWSSMLHRCYDPKKHARSPTYVGCSVSDNFKNYSYFYDWCHAQIGFGMDGWDLDKDILIDNNKIYSEDLCVFVPKDINTFFNDCGSAMRELTLGAGFDKRTGKYRARCMSSGKQKFLGRFTTPEAAHAAYKQFKENLCKELANKWRGKIDERVYNAMMVWTV